MKSDPRVQKFYDEAAAAKKELRRLAVEIAARRIDAGGMPVFPVPRIALSSMVKEEVCWALDNGRTDLVVRIVELVGQYDDSMATAAMMQARVENEIHQKTVMSREEGDPPEYLDSESGEVSVIRMAPTATGDLTPVDDDS